MKPWADRSLKIDPQPEMSAIGVEISFDATFLPGISRTSIYYRIFSQDPRSYVNPILFMALPFQIGLLQPT